jgi:alkanesulfonate monooxygenase SsuD/methylene tetrahydromethanopterin reductase-like flavin-dependent oxidoreductase (luciferase family)
VWSADLASVAGLNALTLMAAAARSTDLVELGTYVAPVYAYPPATLAHQALSIQVMSNDRLVLGVGLGHKAPIEAMLGVSVVRPVAYLREYLQVLTSVLGGERTDFDGEFFHVHLQPAVERVGRPPVLVAALGPQMLRLAGEHADGTALTMTGPRYIERTVVPTLTRAAAAARREDVRIAAAVPISVTR